MQPTSKEKEIEKGYKAQLIYDDIKDRIEFIRRNLHEKWEGTSVAEAQGRENVWFMLKALNELERSFLTDIDTGKLAQLENEEND